MQLTGEGLLDEESAFKIRKDSVLKNIVMCKSDTWPQVTAKIAGAFQCLPYESASIMCDAELEVGPTIPTLREQFHLGGRTTIGLCINDYYEDEVGRSSFYPSPKLLRVYFKILLHHNNFHINFMIKGKPDKKGCSIKGRSDRLS